MNRILHRTATGPLFAAVMLVLAACAAEQDVTLPTCPKATVLEETSTLTRFRDGPGQDLIDVNFTGKIEHLTGSCVFDVDSAGAGLLKMDVSVEVRVDRGPANRDRTTQFEYFVGILNANGTVIAKEIFPFSIKFSGNNTTSKIVDAPVTMNIPVTADQGSADFSVFVGFQLTPDELRYNRDIAHGRK